MKLIQPQEGEVYWNADSFTRFSVFKETPAHRFEVGGYVGQDWPIVLATYDSKIEADGKLLESTSWLAGEHQKWGDAPVWRKNWW